MKNALTMTCALLLLSFGCGKKKDEKSSSETASEPASEATHSDAKKMGITKSEAMAVVEQADALTGEAACKLVSKEEATTALGKPVKDGVADPSGCTWDAEEGGLNTVLLGLRAGPMWPTAKKATEEMAKERKKTFEVVEGLGDDAFYNNVIADQLNVKVGDTYLELSLMGAEGDDAKQRLLDLGKAIAAKMK